MKVDVALLDGAGAALAKVRAGLSALVAALADEVAQGAKDRLTGPREGRVYHAVRASAPGEAPADAHGVLADSISAQVNGLDAEVVAGAPFAAYLELGTAKMAPRPFLSPAANAVFDRAEEKLDLNL